VRIVLKFHDSVRPALSEWYRTLGPTDHDRREWLGVFLEAFAARLTEFDGIPPEAVRTDGRSGSVYTVECGGAVFFEYQLRDDPPQRGWRRVLEWIIRRHRVRTALVIGLTGRRPPG
jgi:hypothetical protein